MIVAKIGVVKLRIVDSARGSIETPVNMYVMLIKPSELRPTCKPSRDVRSVARPGPIIAHITISGTAPACRQNKISVSETPRSLATFISAAIEVKAVTERKRSPSA